MFADHPTDLTRRLGSVPFRPERGRHDDRVVQTGDIARLMLGSFIRPAQETGTASPRVEVVLGYLVRHEQAWVLLDTGIGEAGRETEEGYRPRRVPLADALATVGARLDDVSLVTNCHLHFDHCGGNHLLPRTPIVVQRRELSAAHEEDYTVPELVDFAGARYEQVDGEVELLPGLLLVPTPGHTDGHQSLVVRCQDGTVVLAGQSHDHSADFGADAMAAGARGAGAAPPLPITPAWMDRLLDLDPRRVTFAHDSSVWEPPSG
jgi:N-acyl homoserine lactone hydrolase